MDFGELPVGEIPTELKSSPSFQQTKLENGVLVLTEEYKGLGTSVSLLIRGGSRFETLS